VPTYTTDQIRHHVDGQLEGPGDLQISGVDELRAAGPGQITFIGDTRHSRDWPSCAASAALLGAGLDAEGDNGRAIIRVDDADLALAVVLDLFAPSAARAEPGVHESAVVDASATLGRSVSIGANSVIGPNVTIGDGTIIHANATALDDTQIGAGCVIWPGVVIRERCKIGDGCTLHPNVTIGADGFGYRKSPDGRGVVKIPHIGTVIIGNQVEIGAGTCVDRGKFSATRIGDGTKIDNLCQIAHNCRIGRCCLIAGCSALAGTVVVGDGCMLGGHVSVKDHVCIGAGAALAARSDVMGDVPEGATWAGTPAREATVAIREHLAMRRLPDLLKDLKRKKGDADRS